MSAETPWLPELPSHWEVLQMRRCVTFRNGADYRAVEVDEGGFPVYGSGGEFRRARDYLYDGPSVLFGRKGTIDQPLLVSGKFWTVDTMFYTELGESIVPRYLHYYAITMPFSFYSTNTAVPSMTQGDLGSHRMPLPPLEEQRIIADYLDRETYRVDTLINEQKRLIELLGERRWAVVERRVALLAWDTPYKTVSRLIQTGPFGSQLKSSEYVDDGIPVINPSHIVAGEVAPDSRITVSTEKAKQLARHALQEGDLIVARRGDLGRCAVVRSSESGFLCGTGSAIIRLDRARVDSSFAEIIFGSRRNREALTLASVGSTMENLNSDIIGALRLPVPRLDEQRSVVEELKQTTAKIDTLIAEAEQFIELSRERRSALITAAVTGQIDVRELA